MIMEREPTRLKHLSNYSDVVRGAPYTLTPNKVQPVYAGRKMYRVNKNGAPMHYVFALGNHVIDIRDLAHLYCPEMLMHCGYFDVNDLVIRTILEKAEPHLLFPRKPSIYQRAA